MSRPATDGGAPTRILAVTGGSHGMAATYDHLEQLAAGYDRAGDRMRGWAGSGARTLGDPDLLESALLAPSSFAAAEKAVVLATTGPDGILVESVRWEADALLVQAVIASFRTTDELVRGAMAGLDYQVGHALGFALAIAGPQLITAYAVDRALPDSLHDRLGGLVPDVDVQQEVIDHPGLVQHLVHGGGGLLDGLIPLPGFTPTTGDAARDLAALYGPETSGHAIARPDLHVESGDHAPADVQDAIAHLRDVAALSHGASSPDNGTIEIQTLTGADGVVRHIVYLPGTDDMGTLPWTQDEDVRDMGENLLLMSGHDTAYQQGIEQAMDATGIGRGDPVLLVGHSQGGMQAVAMVGDGRHHVTDVITAGSPTAQVHGFPSHSHVLSLEHQGDVVPLTDGADNPDSPQQVTVRFQDHDSHSVVGNHDFPHYVDGAAAVDRSSDPSVRDAVRGLHHRGYLGPQRHVETQIFQIVRGS